MKFVLEQQRRGTSSQSYTQPSPTWESTTSLTHPCTLEGYRSFHSHFPELPTHPFFPHVLKHPLQSAATTDSNKKKKTQHIKLFP